MYGSGAVGAHTRSDLGPSLATKFMREHKSNLIQPLTRKEGKVGRRRGLGVGSYRKQEK